MRLAPLILLVSAVLAGGCNRPAVTAPSTGPSGGDLVPVKGGTAYAELLANADTGEVMVHTWDKDLRTRRPVERGSIRVGAGESSAELMPHPTGDDPPGMTSRFYGHADWVRGGTVRHGWLAMSGEGSERHPFDWQGCWQGGKAHGRMWEEMGEHRHMGRGPGHRGGPNER